MLSSLKNAHLPSVIFVTAYDQYALKAFEVHAVDYLLKPVSIEHLQHAVERVRKRSDQNNIPKQHHVSLSTSKGLIILKTADILYCKGDGAYTYFHLKSGERITTSKNLKAYEDRIEDPRFFRCHKSYLINLEYIHRFEKINGGYVILSQGAKVPVASRKREELLNLFEMILTVSSYIIVNVGHSVIG